MIYQTAQILATTRQNINQARKYHKISNGKEVPIYQKGAIFIVIATVSNT